MKQNLSNKETLIKTEISPQYTPTKGQLHNTDK